MSFSTGRSGNLDCKQTSLLPSLPGPGVMRFADSRDASLTHEQLGIFKCRRGLTQMWQDIRPRRGSCRPKRAAYWTVGWRKRSSQAEASSGRYSILFLPFAALGPEGASGPQAAAAQVREAVVSSLVIACKQPRWAALTSEHLTFAKMIEAGDSKVTQIFHNTKLLPTETLRATFEKYDVDHNGGTS